jgi:methylmalonyl-CoA mutase
MTKAVAEGLPKHRIEEAAAARAAKVDVGETVIVGVNRYRLPEEEEHDILEVDTARERAGQIARLEKMRSERDEAAKLSRRFGALDLLHLGDGHLSVGDTELRESFDQLSRQCVRVEGRRCPYRDVGARGRLANLVLEHLTTTTERRRRAREQPVRARYLGLGNAR